MPPLTNAAAAVSNAQAVPPALGAVRNDRKRPMMATQRIDPAKTTAAARCFAGLARELGETEAVAHVEDALARTKSGLFRLVVAGEVKKGKSSLVNTLLGVPDLLP